jgi:hypothetical protein
MRSHCIKCRACRRRHSCTRTRSASDLIFKLVFYVLACILWSMEHIICESCDTEYDIREVDARGWRRLRYTTNCEVCGAVLKAFDQDYERILIITKRGLVREAV